MASQNSVSKRSECVPLRRCFVLASCLRPPVPTVPKVRLSASVSRLGAVPMLRRGRRSCLIAKGRLLLLKSRTRPHNALPVEMKSPSTLPQVGMRERQSGAGRFHPGVLERRIQARPTKSEMPTARPSGSQNSARGAPKSTDFRREDRRSVRRLWVESMPRPTISWRHTTLPNLPSPRRFADVHRERVHSLPCWA